MKKSLEKKMLLAAAASVMMFMSVSCGKLNHDINTNPEVLAETPKQVLLHVNLTQAGASDPSAERGVVYAMGRMVSPEQGKVARYDGTGTSFKIKLVHLACGIEYSYCTYVKKDGVYAYGDISTFKTAPLPEHAVDLNLDDDVLWAEMNVGAKIASDYGDAFAFGEVETKEEFTNQNYRFFVDYAKYGSGAISKYTFDDGNTICSWYDDSGKFIGDGKKRLDPEDDAAAVQWGGRWRMPTGDEFASLVASSKVVLTTQNGHKGALLQKNGKKLFFPFSWQKIYVRPDLDPNEISTILFYRTSELFDGPRPPVNTKGGSDKSMLMYMRNHYAVGPIDEFWLFPFSRATGLPVRAVYDCNIEMK